MAGGRKGTAKQGERCRSRCPQPSRQHGRQGRALPRGSPGSRAEAGPAGRGSSEAGPAPGALPRPPRPRSLRGRPGRTGGSALPALGAGGGRRAGGAARRAARGRAELGDRVGACAASPSSGGHGRQPRGERAGSERAARRPAALGHRSQRWRAPPRCPPVLLWLGQS